MEGFGPQYTRDELKAIFEINQDLVDGRFAIDPGNGQLVYGGRINVFNHSKERLLKAFDRVVISGAYWNTKGLRKIRDAAKEAVSSGSMTYEKVVWG